MATTGIRSRSWTRSRSRSSAREPPRRRGPAPAAAAKHLARRESRSAAIIGCGVQGRVQLQSLREVLALERVAVYDLDRGASDRFVGWVRDDLELEARVASSASD